MSDKDTGATTGTEGGVSGDAQDTTASTGEASDLRQELQETQAALKEQQSVQSGLDKRINELKSAREKLASRNQELESEVERLSDLTMTDDVKSEYEEQLKKARLSAEEQTTELRGELDGLSGELESLKSQNERLRVLVSDFPDLNALVAADALPQAETIDDFRAKLEALGETFVSKADANAFARTQGSRPPSSPPAESPDSLDTIKERMDAARKNGNKEEYENLKEQWFDRWDDE